MTRGGTWIIENRAEEAFNLNMEIVMVESDEKGGFPLFTNTTAETVKVEVGHEVPYIQLSTAESEHIKVNALSASFVSHHQHDVDLLRALEIGATKLTFQEHDQLTKLMLDYHDIFAERVSHFDHGAPD